MASKIFNLFLLFSLTLVVAPNVVLVNSLPPTPNAVKRSFKVHVGDTAHYTIENASFENQNYLLFPFFSQRTQPFINLTEGDYLDFKVTNILYAPSGDVVYSDFTIVTPHNVTKLQMINSGAFIRKAFDSTADLSSFINQDTNPKDSYSQYGDMLTTTQYFNGTETSLFGHIGTDPVLILENDTFNWKTGWVQQFELKVTFFTNNSNYLDILVQGHQTINVFSTLVSYTTGLFEIGSLFVVVATIIIFLLIYRSYTKISKKSHHIMSFFQYLRNRFHYTKKDHNRLTGSETDQALHTIESILSESQDNPK